MKRGFFTAFVIILFIQIGDAQTIKTGVLIIGDGSGAVGASIQSSISGAKTVLLMPGEDFKISLSAQNLSSGIERDLTNRLKDSTKNKEAQDKIFADNGKINKVLKSWTDTVKNLTIMRNVSWIKIKKSGSGWNVQLADGKTIKAIALVNADRSGKVNEAIPVQSTNNKWHLFNYDNTLYRTSIAAGQFVDNTSATVLFLSDLLVPGLENLVSLNSQIESLSSGQAAGAVAAYAAFFKTKISLAPLKEIQGELIKYRLSPIPFADISGIDSNLKAIQFLGLSGFLKADIVERAVYFKPNQVVTTAEIKEPIKEYYYKAQIWFDDHKESEMTIGSTLDLVCYVGGKSPRNTEEEVKKNWNKAHNFKTEFDPKRAITRREFAVLVNEYLKPFGVNIDKTGRVLR